MKNGSLGTSPDHLGPHWGRKWPNLGHLGHPLGLRLILGQKVLNKSRFPMINGLLGQSHDPLGPQGGRKWPKVGHLGHPLALGIILGPKV